MKTPQRQSAPPAPSSVLPADDGARAFARNRCPLWRGRVNTWMLRRSLRGNPTNAHILTGARIVMSEWFARGNPWSSDVVVSVLGLKRRRALELSDGIHVACTSDSLAPLPIMLGDSFASVELAFLYFGEATEMPWPVQDSAGLWSPVDCIWALDLVGVRNGA